MAPRTPLRSSILPSVERFAGFADTYDECRPAAPDVLGDILCGYAKTTAPSVVVDIGCGTGLSTRYWADRAVQVIGVDPAAEMLEKAKERTVAGNVYYVAGLGERTGLEGGRAGIVTYSNCLHWMEPEPTLAEAVRLLRRGGVFAAYYHDQYPMTSAWEADRMYRALRERAISLDAERGITARARKWDRMEHLPRMRASGCFRHLRELSVHHVEEGNAEGLVGLVMSDGFVRGLMKAGVSEDDLGLPMFKTEMRRILGDELRPWYWTVYLWIGVV